MKKNPPVKPNPPGNQGRAKCTTFMGARTIGVLLLLMQAICIDACTVNTFTAPSSVGTVTHKIGTGD